jgi:hypothetical protein
MRPETAPARHTACKYEVCGFPTFNAEVTLVALTLFKNKPETRSLPPASTMPTACPEAPPLPSEQSVPAYRGDVIVFLLWMGCFLLVASMILYETFVGIFFRR